MKAESVLCELQAEVEEMFVKIETLFSAQCLLKLKKYLKIEHILYLLA